MKRMLTLFALLLSLGALAQVKSPDTLVHRAIRALHNNDETAFLRLYPDFNQFKEIIRLSLSQLPDEQRKQAEASLQAEMGKLTEEKYKAEMYPEFGRTFKSILEKGSKKGIDWKTVQVKTVAIDTSDNAGPRGFKAASGIVTISSSTGDHELKVSDLIYAQPMGGWFGIELDDIRKQGEEWSSEELGATDSAAVMLDTLVSEVPPPPPPPAKKPAPKKTTTPSKTPARKPSGTTKTKS